MAGLFSIIYGLKNPEAIDELHHFSRLLLHHQLAKIGVANDRIVQYKKNRKKWVLMETIEMSYE